MASRSQEPRPALTYQRDQEDVNRGPGLTRFANDGAMLHSKPNPERSLDPNGEPFWAIASDIFGSRYGAALHGTEASWRALPHLKALSGQLFIPTSTAAPLIDNRDEFSEGPSSYIEPWLLQPTSITDNLGLARPTGGPNSRRHHLLFQYKPYCQQDPLHLSEQDIASVLDAAFGRIPLTENTAAGPGLSTPPFSGKAAAVLTPGQASPWSPSPEISASIVGGGQNSTSDVASVVLIKLIMDLYLYKGPEIAFSMVQYMLQRVVQYGDSAAKARVFDLILNLAVHGELLYDAPADQVPEDDAVVAAAVAQLDRAGPSADWRHTVTSALRASLAAGLDAPNATAGLQQQENLENNDEDSSEWPPLPRPAPVGIMGPGIDPRGQRFRQWLRLLLFRMLKLLCSVSGPSNEAAWAAAVSALAALITHEGLVVRSFVEELPLEAAAALLRQAQEQAWPESLRCWLGVIAANLLYTKGSGIGGGQQQQESILDGSRLQSFGGIRSVIVEYLAAPTLRCQRAFFCVMFDYLTGRTREDLSIQNHSSTNGNTALSTEELEVSLAPVRALFKGVYKSQVDAVGAALLYSRAAEALHPLLQLPHSVSLDDVAAALTAQLAASQAEQPSEVVQPPPGFAEQCLGGLQHMAQAVVTGKLDSPELPAESGRINLDALVNALKESSSSGASELIQLLIEAAEQEVLAAVAAGRQPAALLPAPPPMPPSTTTTSTPLVGAGGAAAASPVGPRASTTGNSWKIAGDIQPLQGSSAAESLSTILEQALPDPRGWAALAFIHAVHAALDYAQLATSGLVGDSRSSAAWIRVDFPRYAMHALTLTTDWLALVPAVSRPESIAAIASRAVGILTVRSIDPSDSGAEGMLVDERLTGGAAGGDAFQFATGSDVTGGSFQSKRGPGDYAPEFGPETPPSGVTGAFAESAGTGGGGAKPVSPLARLAGAPVTKLGAAWRKLTGPGSQKGSNEGAVSNASSVEMPLQQVRPLSAGLTSLGPQAQQSGALGAEYLSALPPHPCSARQHPHQQQQQQVSAPPTPSGAGQSLLSLAAQRALGERHALLNSAKESATALASAELQLTPVDSFLSGLARTLPSALHQAPCVFLRALFDELRPEVLPSCSTGSQAIRPTSGSVLSTPPGAVSSASRYSEGSFGGAGSARGIAVGGDTAEKLGRMSAVQAGRPLWDARAAVCVLILQQQQQRNGGDQSSGGTAAAAGGAIDAQFLGALLSDADPRIRRHASMFVLARFAQRHSQQYRYSIREVVTKAQRTNDERLLKSPEVQLIAMLEARLLNLESIV